MPNSLLEAAAAAGPATVAATPHAFTAPITNGASNVVVPVGLPGTPKVSGLAVQKPNDAAPDLSVGDFHTLSGAAFTVELSAAAPLDGYILHGSYTA